MATQRRFEGNTLAAVLAEVQKEIGADAKIASAQKVRRGGIGGFFQRERFEVIVDTDATTAAQKAAPNLPPAAPSPSTPAPASLLDLAEAINNSERKPSPLNESKPSQPEARFPVGRVERPIVDPEPTVSTESNSFADILSRVAFQADMTSEDVAASKSEPKPTVPEIEAKVAQTEEPELPELIAPDYSEPEVVSTEVVALEPERPVIADRPAALDLPHASSGHGAPNTPVRTRITDSPLAQLGLPVEYIPVGVEGSRMHSALVTALQRLPKAPDIRPSKGSVVVVIGERTEAMDLAADLCERWGQPAEGIVLASQTFRGKGPDTVLRTVRNGEDAQRSWSRRPQATIVAIDAHPGSGETMWAEHMLTALEPIATFGIANATRKAEDISAWAKALGGIDALAVNHMSETVSPASVLSTGIPVDRIDGRKASPAYWAMLLVDRLNAA